MRRLRAVILVGLVLAVTIPTAASGQKTQPVLRRPNPVLTSITLDYVNPIPAPGGGWAHLSPQAIRVIENAVVDLQYLRYTNAADLGGFVSAPVGWLANGNCYPPAAGVKCPGRITLGTNRGQTQVPFYKHQAKERINSYTYVKGTIVGPGPCGACTIIVPPVPFPSGIAVPPGNGCFSGCITPGTTTTETTSTGTTETTTTTTTTSGGGSAGDCGTIGLSITSDLDLCRIYIVNTQPGDSTFEKVTITNTSSSQYVLSLRVAPTATTNVLWDDLEMGIWVQGTTPPASFPVLRAWTTAFTPLATLDPGQSVKYEIELYLPIFAGNRDQNLAAIADFEWHAQGTGG
ncbi:MAG TPA: hypothetical protein VKR79_06120 [Gaiellaceae bacterium]|nr:hypothetical protein [Gaiellaceae bacterium]